MSRHPEATQLSTWIHGHPLLGENPGTSITPNKVTKDKLAKFTQQKTHRGISLNKTAGRQSWNKRSNWSAMPTKDHNPRAFGLISSPSHTHSSRQDQLDQVRKEASDINPRKRTREATPFFTHDAPLVISSDEEGQDNTSPTSPPNHERGHNTTYEYQPKSPVYPPPSDSSDGKEFSSIPDLVSPAEGMSPVPDHLDDSGYETQTTVPANVNTNHDNFQDKDRQKNLAQTLEKELSQALWQKEAANGPLEDLETVTKTVKPVYDGFWCDRDQDINRLDLAARKLKEKRAAQLQDNKEDDTATQHLQLRQKLLPL